MKAGRIAGATGAVLLMWGCTTIDTHDVVVHGLVAPGYEPVREAFAENLARRGELGGAFAAYVGDEKVVDLWGGYRDVARTLPWAEETHVLVFSATKGVAAFTLAHLHTRGLLDYDAPVAAYWSEFAQGGKEHITVRQLLSHQAGLVLLDAPVDPSDLDEMAAVIARAEPLWEPGTQHGYHAGTVGLAMQVLVYRIDPLHRTLGTYLQEEIARPLGAEFHIGLPPDFDVTRLAEMREFRPHEALFHLGDIPKGLRQVLFRPKSLFWRSMGEAPVDVNSEAYLRVENASGNGVGTARGMARIYQLALGDAGSAESTTSAHGAMPRLGSSTRSVLFAPPEEPSRGRLDAVMNIDAYYGLGFQKPDPSTGWFSPNPTAIGFMGASGALAFADPATGIAAAYVTNRMSPGTQINDPRERALREALYACAAAAGR